MFSDSGVTGLCIDQSALGEQVFLKKSARII